MLLPVLSSRKGAGLLGTDWLEAVSVTPLPASLWAEVSGRRVGNGEEGGGVSVRELHTRARTDTHNSPPKTQLGLKLKQGKTRESSAAFALFHSHRFLFVEAILCLVADKQTNTQKQ